MRTLATLFDAAEEPTAAVVPVQTTVPHLTDDSHVAANQSG